MKNKGIIDSYSKEIFNHPEFQEKWQTYLDAFGQDLDGIFGDDYSTKVRFAQVLSAIYSGKLKQALSRLQGFQASFTTESDKRIYDRLQSICLNADQMQAAKICDWIKDDIWGYWQIVDRTPQYAIIKNGFNSEMQFESGYQIRNSDLLTYQVVSAEEQTMIEAFFQENPSMLQKFNAFTTRYLAYRDRLLQWGMVEASENQGHFYRRGAPNTAFIVNLADLGEYVQVVYGFTSTASMEGEGGWFDKNGEGSDTAKLRFVAKIRTEADEKIAAEQIRSVYLRYRDAEKEEILALGKEKQKAFLQSITQKLKPLGFKKKGAKWTKLLEDDFCVEFYAQKSAYSDLYYFNISVFNTKINYPQCYSTRLKAHGLGIHNWQLLSDEEFADLLDPAIETILLPIIKAPLCEVGKDPQIWKECACKRDRCEACWVQKNLWEATEEE